MGKGSDKNVSKPRKVLVVGAGAAGKAWLTLNISHICPLACPPPNRPMGIPHHTQNF